MFKKPVIYAPFELGWHPPTVLKIDNKPIVLLGIMGISEFSNNAVFVAECNGRLLTYLKGLLCKLVGLSSVFCQFAAQPRLAFGLYCEIMGIRPALSHLFHFLSRRFGLGFGRGSVILCSRSVDVSNVGLVKTDTAADEGSNHKKKIEKNLAFFILTILLLVLIYAAFYFIKTSVEDDSSILVFKVISAACLLTIVGQCVIYLIVKELMG